MRQAILARVPIAAPRAFPVPVVLVALACIVALGLLVQQSASTRMALLFLTGTELGVVLLAAIAGLLARESKSLPIGERADPLLSESILRIAKAASPLSRANGVLTVQLAPDQVLAGLSLQFPPDLRAAGHRHRTPDPCCPSGGGDAVHQAPDRRDLETGRSPALRHSGVGEPKCRRPRRDRRKALKRGMPSMADRWLP